MQRVVIVESKDGFTVAEITHYTYENIETAKAFARDKWGDYDPALAVANGGPSPKNLAE